MAAEGRSRGWSDEDCAALLAIVPPELVSCACFLDRLTGIWRYEFGRPHQVGDSLIWGTHMWAPVPILVGVLACARLRLPPGKLSAYRKLLADVDKHQEGLAEMFPMLRVDPAIPAEYEAQGRGAGSKTIDWAIGPTSGRAVLMDVKRRYADFLMQMGGPMEGGDPCAGARSRAAVPQRRGEVCRRRSRRGPAGSVDRHGHQAGGGGVCGGFRET